MSASSIINSATVRSLDILAERTGVDSDKLAEAITMLETSEVSVNVDVA